MAALSQDERRRKLAQLAEYEGHESVEVMLQACAADSISSAICTDPQCSFTTDMEPDQDRGYCEACEKSTVVSALVLAGLI